MNKSRNICRLKSWISCKSVIKMLAFIYSVLCRRLRNKRVDLLMVSISLIFHRQKQRNFLKLKCLAAHQRKKNRGNHRESIISMLNDCLSNMDSRSFHIYEIEKSNQISLILEKMWHLF